MRTTGYTPRARNRYQIDNFAGFDFSNSPISASKRRATAGKNFFMENGINQKRPGWKEIIRNEEGARINGIWHFTTGGHTYTVVHAGKKIYSVGLENGACTQIYSGETVTDERSYGVYSGGKLYLFCGDYLVVKPGTTGALTATRVVGDADTYIPKTRVGIGYVGQDGDKADNVDHPNILSTRRKNGFTTTNEGDPQAILKYRVDTGKMDPGLVVATLTTVNTDGTLQEKVYTNRNGSEFTTLLKSSEGTEFATIESNTGTVTLNTAVKNDLGKQDNLIIEFEFKPRDTNGNPISNYEKRITACRFGILFGCAGVDDRLFIAGNPDFPNICFHSENDDFTYFPDINTAACGSDTSAITGFSRLGDGTLAIHKEANGQDISIYYRTGEIRSETNGEGVSKLTEVFPVRAGAIGEGVVSQWACANLSGDNLMLSKNGVYGLVLSSNVASYERYARERSRAINEKLLKRNLENAVAVVWKNRYILAVDDVCFVADARYTYREQGDLSDTYNYEWWYWENVPARVFAVIDNRLYFGTGDGRLCVFDGEYTDRTIQKTSDGQVSVDFQNEGFAIDEEDLLPKLKEADLITLSSGSGGLYSLLVESDYVEMTGSRVHVEGTAAFPEDSVIYLNNFSRSCADLVDSVPYVVKDIVYDDAGYSFLLYRNGIANIGENPCKFRIYKKLEGRTLEVDNVEEHNGTPILQVKEIGGNEVLIPAIYGNTTASGIVAEICFRRNVCAEWYTPMLDLGNSTSIKQLRSINIVLEPFISGKVVFGYVARSHGVNAGALNLSGFSFENIDFNDFTFNINNFAANYTKRVMERKFNYIMLRVISDTAFNCAFNSIGIEYTITKRNKGVQ